MIYRTRAQGRAVSRKCDPAFDAEFDTAVVGLGVAGAVAAIEDREYFERTRGAVIRTREQLVRDLSGLGFEVLPSAANFVFARHPAWDALDLAKKLRERSIIVRHFRLPRIDQYLRITVGTDDQCTILVRALTGILS